MQGLARIHRLAQFLGGDLLTSTGDLDVGGMWRLLPTHHHRYAGHPFAANQAHFDARVVWLNGDYRRDTGLHEINSFNPFDWVVPYP